MTDKEIRASDEEMEQFNVLQNEKCVLAKEEKLNELKDKEIAEKYANECCGLIKELHWQDVKWAVLYGLKEGRKEKWHNLRKNPDDLPKEKGMYWVYCYSLGYEKFCYMEVPYGKRWGVFDEVIAWCELPKFEE